MKPFGYVDPAKRPSPAGKVKVAPESEYREFRHMHTMVNANYVRDMDPRARDYLGIRRVTAIGDVLQEGDPSPHGRVVTVWAIDPIPFCELVGAPYETYICNPGLIPDLPKGARLDK